MTPVLGLALVLVVGLLSRNPAPPPADRVVLLPGPEGKVGKVEVSTREAAITLDDAYRAAHISRSGKIAAHLESEASVRERYGAALEARPPRPVSFLLYFESGRDELAPESLPTVADIKAELAKRPVPEITVVGHTDRVGSVEANDRLALKRAEAMRSLLTARGIEALAIEVAGRGEREPLVPTADEVPEARNRRVEIVIR